MDFSAFKKTAEEDGKVKKTPSTGLRMPGHASGIPAAGAAADAGHQAAKPKKKPAAKEEKKEPQKEGQEKKETPHDKAKTTAEAASEVKREEVPSHKVSFIGVGAMGAPMVGALLAGGHKVTLWNRTRDKVKPLEEKGAIWASNPAIAFQACPTSFLCLSDHAAVSSVLDQHVRIFGTEGQPMRGHAVINMTTISSQQTLELSQRTTSLGGIYIECPVLGSVPQATDCVLRLLVGAPNEAVYEQYRPILTTFGSPSYIGPVGSASVLKLAFNQMIISEVTALAVSLSMVDMAGLSTDVFMEILRKSPFHANYMDFKYPAMKGRHFFPAHFTTKLMLKDVDLMLVEMERLGVGSEALRGVRAILKSASDRGFDTYDFSSVFSVVHPRSEQVRVDSATAARMEQIRTALLAQGLNPTPEQLEALVMQTGLSSPTSTAPAAAAASTPAAGASASAAPADQQQHAEQT